MIKIAHRINKISDLTNTPNHLGVEVDIRSWGNELIIHHDPYKEGEKFIKWLDHYNHQMLILNVKEEGLEERLINLMQKKKIEDFFFLDQSFPFLIKHSQNCKGKSAVRFSEYECIETVLQLRSICNWIWVDCFNINPLTKDNFIIIKNNNFKICVVSPELQGRTKPEDILNLKQSLKDQMIFPDAVCTKRPDLW